MEFEDKPDTSQGGFGTGHGKWIPMGARSQEGVIVPFSMPPPGLEPIERTIDTDASGATQELLFTGRAECVPDCVQRLVKPIDTGINLYPIITPRFRTTRMQKDGLVAFRLLRRLLRAVVLKPKRPALSPLRILPCRNTLWQMLLTATLIPRWSSTW
jgi:hypothetical protein